MSTPLSSLKKTQKSPLLGAGISSFSSHQNMASVPFRPGYTDDESKLLDEITSNMISNKAKHMRDPFNGGLPQQEEKFTGRPSVTRGSNSSTAQTSPRGTNSKASDHELMSIMMSRLSQLEQKVQFQSKDIVEKDKKIRILEDKVRILKKARETDSPTKTQDLEKKCLLLQQQIHEMELFLSDYGMVWVGEQSDDETDVYAGSEGSSEGDITARQHSQTLWRPKASLPTTEFRVDFNQVIENVKELNVLAGEGVARVQRTTDGARLKIPESVPLILYSNGIVLFRGPFRPFNDPTTQQCVRDLTDGYFPGELQTRYPDGVPFVVTDKRDIYFKTKSESAVFQGSGQLLGGETKPSRLIPSNLNKTTTTGNDRGLPEETELPGPKLSVDKFLDTLPSSVIKDGKVIDIRGSLRQELKDSSTLNDVTVIETDVVKELKSRLEIEQRSRPPTPRNITTLRIKAETGDKTYVLKMKFHNTVGDLRNYIEKNRPVGSAEVDILCTFPSRVLEDDHATLQSCGLTPNATLHLRVKTQSGKT